MHEVIMWGKDVGKEGKFHCKNVKKACIYRIIVETDLTIYIVGADRGMYLPALGPSKTNASPPPTNDGVKVGNSSTVKSQEGYGGKRWQKSTNFVLSMSHVTHKSST